MIKWLLNKLWEKINLASTYREIKTLGKKYGKRFSSGSTLDVRVELKEDKTPWEEK